MIKLNRPKLKNIESKSEEILSPLKLPDVNSLDIDEEKEKFKKYFKEVIDEEGITELNKGNKESYNQAKSEYEHLFGIFNDKKADPEDLLKSYENEVSKLGFNKLEDLEKAIDNNDFDLSKYDMFTFSKLLRKMEENESSPDLDKYNIKDMEDFYNKISSGEINISNYSQNHIDDFIDKLIKERKINDEESS